MKKVLSVIVCLLLLVALAIPAFAADVNFSISASGKTLYRGDTVTLTVNCSSSADATQYGIKLAYDSSVFEYVEHKISVSDALVKSFRDNGFAFMFQEATAYSGSVGTVTLRVKDNAPVGTYTISGNPSAKNGSDAVGASSGSVSITVSCQHTYGEWTEGNGVCQQVCTKCGDTKTAQHQWKKSSSSVEATCKDDGVNNFDCTVCGAKKSETVPKNDNHTFGNLTAVDGQNHKDTCSVCKKEIQQAHTWNSGKVTKPATCKEDGVKTITCTGCGYEKTEAIAKTDSHTYGAWQTGDGENHIRSCTVCQKQETAAHSWNSGKVTKPATCKEEGVKTYTCTACKQTKTETIALSTTHSWGKWTKVDADSHKRACTVCALEETGSHSYKTSWSKDSKEHWHECKDCKDKIDVEAHIPGAEATETTPQTCKTCKYILKAALGHTHAYASEWTTDETGHWYTCSGCEEKGEFAAHDFENDCDPDCSICGFTREAGHSFGTEWVTDGENHWHACAGCGAIEDQEAHIPGAEATEESAQTCTVCEYELAPALGVKETEPAPTTPATTGPVDDGNDVEKNEFPWWIIVVAVVVVGGVVFFVFKKKN